MIKLRQSKLILGVALAAGGFALAGGVALLQNAAHAQKAMVEVPIFEVDPFWPKPLPNEGLLGMTIGAAVDAHVAGDLLQLRRGVRPFEVPENRRNSLKLPARFFERHDGIRKLRFR